MYERHENEQYFFDEATIERLAGFVSKFDAPCCLCAPSLGKRLSEQGCNVAILDIDERFSDINGFRKFDIYRPDWLGTKFDLIVCDPPFFNVSLSQLFSAIRLLAQHDDTQPMLVSYLSRRSDAIVGTFSRFQLEATGYFPGYKTVQKCERNDIEFFGNVDVSFLLDETE